MTLIPPTFPLPLGLRATLINGAQAYPNGSDDVRQLAEAIQHLAWRLASAEHALTDTHDRCAMCGGWIKKSDKAVRIRIDAESGTHEPTRVLAYHGHCLGEQDPERVEDIIASDCEKVGGEFWAHASDLPRLHGIRAAMLRGLHDTGGSECLYRITLENARNAGHLPREWKR